MNASLAGSLRAAWLAPWRATSRQSLWASASVAMLLALGALVIGATVPGRGGILVALACYAFGLWFWWQFCVASLVVLARDARLARVPGVAGNTVASVALYAIVSLLVPMLVAGVVAHAAGFAALISALAAASALALAFLPRLVGMCAGLVPAAYVWLHALHVAPSPFDPHLQAFGWVLLVVLVLLDAVRWRQLLTGDGLDDNSRGGPMLASLRLQATRGNSVLTDGTWWARARRPHAPRIQLEHIGPQTPVKAIRIALSGWLAPLTAKGRFIRYGYALLIVPLMAIAALPGLTTGPHPVSLARSISLAAGFGFGWLLVFSTAMLPFFIVGLVQRRWTHGGELALLALLPGLDREQPTARSITQAILVSPFAICGVGLAATLVAGIAMHAQARALLPAVLLFIGIAVGTAWATLRIVGGRPLSTLATVVAIIVGSLGFAACVSAAGMAASRSAPAGVLAIAGALTLLVAVLCIAGAWAAWRAWLHVRARPHAFLGNAQ